MLQVVTNNPGNSLPALVLWGMMFCGILLAQHLSVLEVTATT